MSSRPPSLVEEAATWARNVPRSLGRPCTLCTHTDMRAYVEEVVRLWIAGEAPHMSWPKLAVAVRARFGTRTVWESIRRHIEVHTDLWVPLNEWRRTQR